MSAERGRVIDEKEAKQQEQRRVHREAIAPASLGVIYNETSQTRAQKRVHQPGHLQFGAEGEQSRPTWWIFGEPVAAIISEAVGLNAIVERKLRIVERIFGI